MSISLFKNIITSSYQENILNKKLRKDSVYGSLRLFAILFGQHVFFLLCAV